MPRAPHSTLPGFFMRPRGSSSVALSAHDPLPPTRPFLRGAAAAACPARCRVSPVHVPWSASARPGGSRKGPSAELPAQPPLLTRPCPCLPRFALTCPAALQRPGPWTPQGPRSLPTGCRVGIPSPCPADGSWGPRGQSCGPGLPRAALPHTRPAGLAEPVSLQASQVLFSLHQDLRQPGDGHTHVGRIALSCGSSVAIPLTRRAQKLRGQASDGLRGSASCLHVSALSLSLSFPWGAEDSPRSGSQGAPPAPTPDQAPQHWLPGAHFPFP